MLSLRLVSTCLMACVAALWSAVPVVAQTPCPGVCVSFSTASSVPLSPAAMGALALLVAALGYVTQRRRDGATAALWMFALMGWALTTDIRQAVATQTYTVTLASGGYATVALPAGYVGPVDVQNNTGAPATVTAVVVASGFSVASGTTLQVGSVVPAGGLISGGVVVTDAAPPLPAGNGGGGAALLIDVTKSGQTVGPWTIDATGQPYGVKIEGAHDVVLDGVTVRNAQTAGIQVRGSARVTIRNCIIETMDTSGIQISNAASSTDITIEGCTIRSVKRDGILVAVNDLGGVHHQNVVIRRNRISDAGQDLSWPGHYHGIYMQSTGYTIESNLIYDVHDGSGISTRAGGMVRNNTVLRTGKHGISYYADHDSTGALEWTVQDNRVWASGLNTLTSSNHGILVIDFPVNSLTWITHATITGNLVHAPAAGSAPDIWLPAGFAADVSGNTLLTSSPPETMPTP
ncbi:hypothetical protein GCM10028785_25670 [Hydrogenophaga soli]